MDDISLLLADLSAPGTNAQFDGTPTRTDPATIQGAINPPAITWYWVSTGARQAQVVIESDVGKYGLQTDLNLLYLLTSAGNPSRGVNASVVNK